MSFVRTKESKEHRHHWAVMELLQGKRLRLRTNHRGTLQAWKRWPDFTGHQLTLAKLLEFFCWSSLLLNNDSFDGGKTSFFQVQDDLSWMRERTIKEEMKAGQASIWTTISLLVCLLVWLFFFFFFQTGSYSIAQAGPEHTMKPRMASKSWQPFYVSVQTAGITCEPSHLALLSFLL